MRMPPRYREYAYTLRCTSTWFAASWKSRPQASEPGGVSARLGETKAPG